MDTLRFLSTYPHTRVATCTEFPVNDLAVSLDVETPAFDDEAADLVVTVLARTARSRHGTVPVLRGLARHERSGARIAAF